jgi:hypothetical protein
MANNTNVPAVAPFTVALRKPNPKLIPVHQVEADASKNDLFDSGTNFVEITDPTSKKTCLLFVPSGASTTVNNIHIFFGPGDSGNDALTGALRFSANAANVILLVVPGAEPGFVTMSAAEVVEIMRKAGRPTKINGLRLSSHSRGHRGLTETIRRDLLVQRSGAVVAPKVGPGVVARVVNFDSFYFDHANALKASGIPAAQIFGFHVTIPMGGPGPGKWSATASQTVDLAPVLNGLRAVLYSRLIQDAIAIGKRSLVPPPPRTMADITGRLLTNMPQIPGFSSRSSPTDFRAFCKANTTAITNCLKDEQNTNLDSAMTGPLIEFVNNNNLTGLTPPPSTADPHPFKFSANIFAHHLIVAELAHEVTDSADPKP